MKKDLRERVWMKYNGHCAYCGKNIAYNDMQVDHLIPKHRSRGGGRSPVIDTFNNYMPSCRRCNHYKRSYSLSAFRELLRTIHERIIKIYIVKVAIDYGMIEFKPFECFYFEKEKNVDSLPLCPHDNALCDWSGEWLQPTCGCSFDNSNKITQKKMAYMKLRNPKED